jgi:tetratricopeptide (TPR) repeat protein
LALVFRTIGEHEKAIAEAEKAVALGPGSSVAYAELGADLRFAGLLDESIPVLKKAIRLSPLSSIVLYSLA